VVRSGRPRNLPEGVALHGTGQGVVGWEGVLRLFEALLEIQRSRLTHAFVDAISDRRDLPAAVEEIRVRLIEFGTAREVERRGRSKGIGKLRRGDPQMGIELDLQNAKHFELAKTFGPYSIHCEVFVEGFDSPSVTSHDSGWSLSFLADAGLLDKVSKVARVDTGDLRH
jgi:hypothetical protein